MLELKIKVQKLLEYQADGLRDLIRGALFYAFKTSTRLRT